MNVWRWLGTSILLVVLSVGVSAYGQDKDKSKDKDKQAEKDKDKKDDKGKKDDAKKDDTKKDDKGAKVETGSDTILLWKALDKPGTSFYQEMKTTTNQTMKVMQMEVKQKQEQTFYISWTPEKRDKDNNFVVKQEIIGVKMDIEIGGNKISYDSTAKDQPANPLTDFFKALVGAKFTLTVDPKTMQVKNIDGRKEFIDNLTKANPQLKSLLEQILSENALKQMADPVFGAVPPDGKVPASKTWSRSSELNMGPIGTYKTKYDYTYKDTKGDTANIDVVTKLEYAAPKEKGTEGLPFRIASATLKSDKGAGTVQFDSKEGRIASSDMKLELKGDLTIDIAGMMTEVNLDQSQVSTLKTMDKNPLTK